MRIYGTWQKKLTEAEVNCSFIRGTVEAREPATAPLVEKWVAKFIEEFGVISLSGKCPVNPPIRGPFGLAEIWLKPGAVPVSVAPSQVTGETRAACVNLVDSTLAAGKLGPGVSAWNTPSFPVPKKEPVEYRLVQDLWPQNGATIKDGHPLPPIGDILLRQGRYKP